MKCHCKHKSIWLKVKKNPFAQREKKILQQFVKKTKKILAGLLLPTVIQNTHTKKLLEATEIYRTLKLEKTCVMEVRVGSYYIHIKPRECWYFSRKI